MASTENASVGPATPPKRRPWSRFLSGFLLTLGVLALKLKALAFVVFDYLRNFAVNPLPIGMLDGGRISAAITKWMWVIGGGLLLYKVVRQPNVLLMLVVLLVAFQVYASIVREHEDKHFYDITLSQRAFVAAAYFSLVIFLGQQTYTTLHRLTG